MSRKILSLLFLFIPLAVSALDCQVCGGRIRGRYISTESAVYCSRDCYLTTMPACSGCGNKCEQQVITMQNKKFCSRECMYEVFKCRECGGGSDSIVTAYSAFGDEIILCSSCNLLDKCYYCAMPGTGRALKDGRRICRICRRTAVVNHDEIRTIFRQVRANMGKFFGFDQGHKIELVIVSVRELEKNSKTSYMPDGGRRLALMKYENTVSEKRYPDGRVQRVATKERCRIFVMDNVPRAVLIDALAHELTHDYLRHNAGRVNKLAEEEGFCELTAALYNERTGNHRLNRRKELSTDPVYGGGYREMRARYLRNGKNWKKTARTIKSRPLR